jgi:hypothetical protein
MFVMKLSDKEKHVCGQLEGDECDVECRTELQQEAVIKKIGLKFQIDWRAPQRDMAAFPRGKMFVAVSAMTSEDFPLTQSLVSPSPMDYPNPGCLTSICQHIRQRSLRLFYNLFALCYPVRDSLIVVG